MKNNFRKIRMEDVRRAIEQKGYYTISTARVYCDDFIGPKLMIVTDMQNFNEQNPELAEMIILSTEKFAPMAEEFNRYMWNERRALWRQNHLHNQAGYYEDDYYDEISLSIADTEQNPVEDAVDRNLQKEEIRNALGILTETQRRRIEMYYFQGLTYRQIADREQASDMSIRESIADGLKKSKKNF